MSMDNAHMRPIVDCTDMLRALEEAYKIWQDSGKGKKLDQDCIDNVNKNFLWGDKRDLLMKIFKDTLTEPYHNHLKNATKSIPIAKGIDTKFKGKFVTEETNE